MEYMFTPVRAKTQRSCAVYTPGLQSRFQTTPAAANLTPVKRSVCKCEILKRLNLLSDAPVYSSPRLELVRKRVVSNNCKAVLRKGEADRCRKKDNILRVKRKALKEKNCILAQKYADLRMNMAAILDSLDSPSGKKSVIVTAV